MSKYISSFSDKGLELKIFVNEELGRLKNVLSESLSSDEIKSDNNMLQNAKIVLSKLENFAEQPINESMVRDILKMQQLAQEIEA